jgi:hypothetical protein
LISQSRGLGDVYKRQTLAKANIIQKYYALLNATGQLTTTFTISKL